MDLSVNWCQHPHTQESSSLFVPCSLHAGFLFLHFCPLQNELCKVAPWEGVGIAHLIKELLEINAPLLGAPVGALMRVRLQVHTPAFLCVNIHKSVSAEPLSLWEGVRVSLLVPFL